MSAHTPGPWFTKDGLNQACACATTVARGGSAAYPNSSWWIFSDADDFGDTAADARLIASAPDLLVELIRLRDYLRSPKFDPGNRAAYVCTADAAIFKATGAES